MKELAIPTTAPVSELDGMQTTATAQLAAGLSLIWSEHAADLPTFVALGDQTFTIGRGDGNTLALPDDDAASRAHAKLCRLNEHFVLTDLGSTNGTWVAGRRVTDHLLADHDVIRIGNTLLRFVASDARVFLGPNPAKPALVLGGPRLQVLAEAALRAARSALSIVLCGENGTGKEDFAQAIHRHGQRPGPFVKVHCAAARIESELFGDLTGSSGKPCLLTRANGGTLFLDELADLPLEAQAKLMRVLSERSFWPLGATSAQPVDVHVVCATKRPLERAIQSGRLRSDLFSQLAQCIVSLPPLRERREDLGMLVDHFLCTLGHANLRVSVDFMDVLSRHDFPGNVDELASLVKVAVELASDGVLASKHLPEALRTICSDEPTRPVVLRDSAKTLQRQSASLAGDDAGRAASN